MRCVQQSLYARETVRLSCRRIPTSAPEDIAGHKGIIANPNCSTIIMLMALKPIYDLSPITKIVVSTYQAVSGAGKEGIDELKKQVEAYMNGEEPVAEVLPTKSLDKHYPIAFNLLPHIDVFLDNDYSKEEMKLVKETHKILHNDTVAVSPTTVRVPVFRSHAEAIYAETERELSVDEIRRAIAAFPGAQVQDDLAAMEYPMPLYTAEKYDVYVGRIRKDLFNPRAVNLWVSGDQIRKGAALNALQIAEYIIGHAG